MCLFVYIVLSYIVLCCVVLISEQLDEGGINAVLFFFRNVLVKGGDLPDSSDAIDVFFDGM